MVFHENQKLDYREDLDLKNVEEVENEIKVEILEKNQNFVCGIIVFDSIHLYCVLKPYGSAIVLEIQVVVID